MFGRASWRPAFKPEIKSVCNKLPQPQVCPSNTCKLRCSIHLVSSLVSSRKPVDVVCHSLLKLVCLFQALKVLALVNSLVAFPHNKADEAAQVPNSFHRTCTVSLANSPPELRMANKVILNS
jgi:hypothetical protein